MPCRISVFNIKKYKHKRVPKEISDKTGNLLLKNEFTWVGHCVVTKVIDEESKKNSNNEIHTALMQSDTDIPAVFFEKKLFT